MIKDAMNLYKSIILDKHQFTISDGDYESYRKILKTQLSTMGYKSYYPSKQSGGMFYKPSIILGKGVELVYELMTRAKVDPSTDNEYIRSIIKRQVALSPKSINFDFRKLFEDGNDNASILDKYFDNELMRFVDEITKSDRGVSSRKVICIHIVER